MQHTSEAIQRGAGGVLRHRPLLNVREVAEWLNVSEGWVRDHASGRRQPLLPSLKLGKVRRFREDEMESFIQGLLEWRVA